MKRRFVFPILLLVAAAILFWLLYFEHPQKQIAAVVPSRPAARQTIKPESFPKEKEYSFGEVLQIANAGDPEEAWRKGYSAPIDFWGKVVDQGGNPIPGTRICFYVDDNPDPYGKSKEFETVSDAEGYFSLEGKRGAALAISLVAKEGWRVIKKPEGFLRYWAKGTPGHGFSSKENPELIVMRKKGEAANLIRLSRRQQKIEKDGTPVAVDLKTGKVADSGKGDLRVECWTDDQNKDEKKRYDWRCRISVPGGGLAPWKGEEGFEFEAPANGYKESDEISMSKTAERWLSSVERKYFVKTADGKYARIIFGMFAGGYHFFVIEGYLNPSGSRNLEYDEAKQIDSRHK